MTKNFNNLPRCSTCGSTTDLSAMHQKGRYIQYKCRSCNTKSVRAWVKRNKDFVRNYKTGGRKVVADITKANLPHRRIIVHGVKGSLYETLVDAEDYDWLNQYYWQRSSRGYVVRNFRGSVLYMHREILGYESEVIDHVNINQLDNRKVNLRPCTQQENMWNQLPKKVTIEYARTSQYRGVSKSKDQARWEATISYRKNKIYIGTFNDELEAAQAWYMVAHQLGRLPQAVLH